MLRFEYRGFSEILNYVRLDYVILDYVGIEHSLVVLHNGLHGLLQSGWTKLSDFFRYDFIEVNIHRTGILL